MIRGNRGQNVFVHNKDRKEFLRRLGNLATCFRVEIHAYALMNTHVHLFVRTREPNLSRFMQRLLTGYSRWFNVSHDTYGHLFQGRYKALVVDRTAYGAEISRYIHLNPVRRDATSKKTVVRQQAALREYRWSSYRAMIGLAPGEDWLETNATLARWGTTKAEQHRNHATFVEKGLAGDITDPREAAKMQSILGHDRFIDRIRRIVAGQKRYDRESAPARKVLVAESIASVMKRVAREYKVDIQDLLLTRKGCGGNEARLVALWLARERCGAQATLSAIGRAMGGVSKSAVSMACRRITRRAQHDKRLRRVLEKLS
jgi:REP element-mobilizing transposase RayT